MNMSESGCAVLGSTSEAAAAGGATKRSLSRKMRTWLGFGLGLRVRIRVRVAAAVRVRVRVTG